MPDIGTHLLRLGPHVLELLAGTNPPERPEAALADLVDTFADYLSSARVLGVADVPSRHLPVDLLSDGVWTWTRLSAFYARSYRVADMRLFAHAASRGFVLPQGWVNPDWHPPLAYKFDSEFEEHRTWRDQAPVKK